MLVNVKDYFKDIEDLLFRVRHAPVVRVTNHYGYETLCLKKDADINWDEFAEWRYDTESRELIACDNWTYKFYTLRDIIPDWSCEVNEE